MKILGRVVLNAPAAPADPPPGPEAGEALQAAMLRAVAAHTTDQGRVDYGRLLSSSDLAEAAARARALHHVDPERLGDRPTRLAFWINCYNALALHGVIALGVRRRLGEVWNFFGRVSYRVGRHLLSLDEIEHGILRGNRRRVLPPWPALSAGDPRRALAIEPMDPRVHFALHCGARSCPPVGVYRAAALDGQLARAARNFLNQEIALDSGGRLACSRLLKWYGDDFGTGEALRAFLLAHLDDGPARRALAAGRAGCEVFRPYSWALAHPPTERA
jgi:Protein of unknown function, DUF547